MQTVQTQIRRRVLRRLSWGYTVGLCPFKGVLGKQGLVAELRVNEPRHDKTNKVTVRPAKTDQSLRCALNA